MIRHSNGYVKTVITLMVILSKRSFGRLAKGSGRMSPGQEPLLQQPALEQGLR